MVSPAALDALADPTGALVDLFSGELDAFPQKVARHFSHLFSSANFYDELPILDVAHPPHVHKDRSLVRFRAMVQDTSLSQEMYLAKRSDGSCGGWGLCDIGDESHAEFDYTNLRECHVIWAVSIPGVSQWCSDALGSTSGNVNSTSLSTSKTARPYKFPLPDTPHIGIQVKIYDLPPESHKSTDIIEFVGVLTSEPIADIELVASAVVPTLHVLFSMPLPITITPRDYPATVASYAKELRYELITWLADEALAGDKIAAEWILLCTIARVQSRHPPIVPPTITLSHFPPSPSSFSIPTISHALALIFPILITIPISLHILNKTAFYPHSEDEDLHSGWLQLPRGSVCVIAEGGLHEGEINEKGLSNIRAVQEALDSQTLQYMFPYSRFSFDTDLSFIILGGGRKSTFFQTQFNLPLQPAPDIPLHELGSKLYKPRDAIAIPTKQKLEEFRQLVCGAKIGNSSLEQSTAQRIQEDYVEERKLITSANVKSIDSNDLMYQIILARLYALSLHRSDVNATVWEKVKVMEAERKARLALF